MADSSRGRRTHLAARHDHSASLQVLDLDVTGPPCGPQAELSVKGYFSKEGIRCGGQLGRVALSLARKRGAVGGISLLVASLGIANTVLMSTIERTREIGIMKAIGAEDREIKQIFFVEASVIGLAGGVVGALLAWVVDALANQLAYQFILQPQGVNCLESFWLPPYLWLGALALLVSVLAALYPASRVYPVTALHHDRTVEGWQNPSTLAIQRTSLRQPIHVNREKYRSELVTSPRLTNRG